MKRRFRITARDVILLTLPLALAVAFAGGAALLDYVVVAQFDDWWARDARLSELIRGRLASAIRSPRAVLLRSRMDAGAHDDFVLRINVPRDAWESGVADPFLSEPEWVDATLVRNGGVQDVRVRRRGDTSVHWTTPKVSFTLRTDRWNHVRGYRELALIGKDVLSADVVNWIPARLGLRTPETNVVPVYLNEQYYGLFRGVEPVDESFVRRHGWLPGNLFRADAAERGEYYKGVPRNVFRNPYIWDRVAEEGSPGPRPGAALLELLTAVQGSTFEHHRRLMALIDPDEIARLVAAMLIAGDPYHMSGVHNQLWYEDPSSVRLHPVPWDLRLLDLENRPAAVNDFLRAVLEDPMVVDAALRHAHRAVEEGLLASAEQRLRDTERRVGPYLEYERLRRELVSDPGDPDAILSRLASNVETLDGWVRESGVRYGTSQVDGVLAIDLQTFGYAGSDLVALEFSAPPGGGVRLSRDLDLDGRLDPAEAAADLPLAGVAGGERLELAESLALFTAWDTHGRGILPGHAHYRLFLRGVADGLTVTPVVRNRITGEAGNIAQLSGEGAIAVTGSWHPWRFERQSGRTVRLAGTTNLTQDLMVGPNDTLVAAPGTRLRLGPDVSVFAEGFVSFVGGPGAPIVIEPSQPGRPWGTVALQGAATAGSHFRHVVFRGGGGGARGRVEYKGMVSVHHVPAVVFSDVVFEDNRRSDDALNAVHSHADLERCVFRRANGDAVDYDYSSGTIRDCEFEDSTNDAIDLMTSSPVISSTRIRASGDKGISIGEESHPLVINTTITGSTRGIEVKDRSRPIVIGTRISGGTVGLLLQVKNWRYAGGGWARVLDSEIGANETDIVVDPMSRLTLVNTSVADSAAGHDAGVAFDLSRTYLAPALWTGDFGRRFDQSAAPWSLEGEGRLRIEPGRLVATVERGTAIVRRPLNHVVAPGERHVLIAALAGRNVQRLRIVLVREDGVELEVAPVLSGGAGAVDLAAIEMGPGSYSDVRIEAGLAPGTGQIDPRTGLVERRAARIDLLSLEVRAVEVDPVARAPSVAGDHQSVSP